jgi:hypothetical protein
VEKCCRAGQTTDENTAHAHCMLDIYGYKHTLRTCNIFCFSSATKVARTRLNFTLYVYCLSCMVLVTVDKRLISTYEYNLFWKHSHWCINDQNMHVDIFISSQQVFGCLFVCLKILTYIYIYIYIYINI